MSSTNETVVLRKSRFALAGKVFRWTFIPVFGVIITGLADPIVNWFYHAHVFPGYDMITHMFLELFYPDNVAAHLRETNFWGFTGLAAYTAFGLAFSISFGVLAYGLARDNLGYSEFSNG